MSWKLCKKSSFGMELKRLVTFRWISEESSKLFPFKSSLSHRSRKKSGGLRSGEYALCSICTPLFYEEVFDDIGCVRVNIVVNKKP
ncbi:hypothetical protein TNCV_1056181 [Trichonephila clavipes]|nr:hypothetical protein TNCV_1056181 [Trichonephila clavipes]